MNLRRALLLVLLAVASCAGPSRTPVATPTESAPAILTPTPVAYWDLLPLLADPAKGWKTHRLEELGLAFQVPCVYDEMDCGRIFVEEKALGENAYTLVGFAGGSIRIRVFRSWEPSLAEYVSDGITAPDAQLITAVEPFSLGGVPARRHITWIPGSRALEYDKSAGAVFEGRLYMFEYSEVVDRSMCDAPPLSEEAVYEHLLSTVEFIR
jgi:hypothetical protein